MKKNKFWSFIEKNVYLIFFSIITTLSLLLRWKLLKYGGGDYDMFLKPWFDELKTNGGLKALGMSIGNYNLIYITILALLTYIPIDSLISIKLVSVIFDYICAITAMNICNELIKDNKHKNKISLLIYTAIILLPTVFLNSSYWAQSDSIYTAFVLISILYLIKKKYTKSFIYLGIAFAFKLQTIFILPLYILIYISERKISLKHFLIIPIVNIITCIPAMIFGRSFIDCMNIYINQTKEYNQFIVLNFPNFYSIFLKGYNKVNINLINTPNEDIKTIGIIITIAIFVVIAFLTFIKKVKFNNKAIIEYGLWSIMIATFFLPQMHDRYLYMGDIISILYLILNKKKYYLPITIELISLYCYTYLLFSGFAINISIVSIIYLIVIIIYSKDMYKDYFTD